jgi:hypothetical protein
MPPPAAAYAPLAGTDELQPLGAAAVERDDVIGGADAPTGGVAAASVEAGAPPLGTDDSEPSEAAEQPAEAEQERQERGAHGAAASMVGSAAAAATRDVKCMTDEELMGLIGERGNPATLKKVEIPWASKLTADGCRKFAERALQLQAEGGMTRDFELHADACDWSEGQLASLAGVALSKLTLEDTKGVTSADVTAFAEGVRELQEQGGMTRDFELVVEGCDWSDGQLASLTGVALSKLTLEDTKGVTSADVTAFAEGVRELQGQEGGMTRDFELVVEGYDWSDGQLASLAGVALSKLSLIRTEGVTSTDVTAFAEGVRELQGQEGGMTRDFELTVRFCDWSDGQLGSLAGVALSTLTLLSTKGVTSADVAAFTDGARQLQQQEEGGMTRDFELVVGDCDWSDGQLGLLAGVALSKLTLGRTKGMTSADVAAFADGARQLQEEGGMTRDFELEVAGCGWSSSLVRTVLEARAISKLRLVGGYGADAVRMVCKKLNIGELSHIKDLTVDSSREFSALLELVLAIIQNPSIDSQGDADNPSASEGTSEDAQTQGEREGSPNSRQRIAIKLADEFEFQYSAVGKLVIRKELVPTDVPPLQLAVAMAAHCKEWAALYPSDTDTLEDFAVQFDEHAAALLDQCNSPEEAELLLLAHFTEEKLAGGSTVPVLDFALRHDARSFAANRWVQDYATKLWTGADVHFVPRYEGGKESVQAASQIMLVLHGLHVTTQVLAVPLHFLGTVLMTVLMVLSSSFGLGGPWAVVPVCIGLGALAVTQLGWSLWTWLLLVPLLLVSALSCVISSAPRAPLHGFSRNLFLSVSLAWNTPFIKYSLFVQLYLFFVLAVTTLATADRQVVGWPELAVYIFGAGLLVAEVTQLMHGKTTGWWKEISNHLSSLWNLLDVSIVALIAVCGYQRLPLIVVENVDGGSGSSVVAESMGQGSASAAVVEGDELTEWRVEDSTAGQAVISALCIVVWLRLLGLMVLSADLGPLIQMVVEMRNDLTKFLLLCAVFVLGFGSSISALLFDDRRSSISSLASALHATAQGLLGTQDMEQVTTQWEAEAVYTLYLVAAQIVLLNLLIAMFASTYERIKENAADEWRLARAQIILEYSHEVRGVLELPVLNLLGLALVPLVWLWRGLRCCSCLGPARVTSRVRLPWEEVEAPKFIKDNAQAAAVHKASIAEMEIEKGMYVVVDEGCRAGRVNLLEYDGSIDIKWLDTSNKENVKYEWDGSRERLALVVARPDDQATLAAAGWRAEWALPPPVSTMHPPVADNAKQEKGQDTITLRRSLHDSEPEAGFSEATLHERWLEERANANPADFAELDSSVSSSADSRADALEQRLTEQMQQMQEQAREQQVAMETKVASLQEEMKQQADESNKRLDQLIALISQQQQQEQQQD